MKPSAKTQTIGSPAGPCSPTSGSHPPPRQLTPAKAGSLSLGLEPVPSKPSESWETAYVFAFIYKFTSLCHDLKTGLKLRAAQDFERILEVDTRTSPSDPTADESTPDSSDAREILTAILATFHDNLKTANANSWVRWLKTYIEDLVKHERQQPVFSILKWKENYLRTRENGFWDLEWHEKVHLLRVLVDHQLTYSAKIKSIIDENHDKASAKSTKQPANLPAKADTKPFQNPLVIKPLGADRHSRTWWQIDDSPRIYGSGNPYKHDDDWTVLSTTKPEYAELISKLALNPALISTKSSDPSQTKSDPCATKESTVQKVKIPSMFTSNRKKTASQDRHLQSEWQLSQTLAEVVQANIEAGEQRVQQLVKEAQRLEELEAKKQRRIALANAPKREADLTRSTPGFGVRSRLRSQRTKPDYVVDSDVVDRKLERAIQEYENPGAGGSDSSRKAKLTKRKLKRKHIDGRESDSEDSEYTGQDASVAGTNEMDEDAEIDGTAETGRPSRKRACASKKATAPGERRSLRVRTKVEVEAEEEPKPVVVEEESQPSTSTWSRSRPPVSSSNSEIIEGPSAEPAQSNENVSVWSRGKLIYVAGKNKYACQPVEGSEKRSAADSTTHSLSALQARLEAMAGDDDDDEKSANIPADRQEDATSSTHCEARKEIDQGSKHEPSLSNLFDADLENNSMQVDGEYNKPAREDLEDGKTSAPSPLVELLHEKPSRVQADQDQATQRQINNASPAGPIQHINPPALSTIV
ncbi:uncharacterized protein PGTG_03633 [Puccinia graminis f. sp. tritici CRL 75-36-700-3]|uniref:WHIM1 domain-containing protein n=1 Tax=Puccinia graminis f. sp. tritici (strain CRL 75-36-700-3 / race SCCL) TaxID=418459 RepID=E3K052_PUCGT|nr:uncharacterized protein PGTG_03633 [Puccinia graminis f. sp. tritici CRL 75-36-700-3]EFP77677.1 hypothetical protein PGTG_03633 [Puccinia graminis f. sp. tritici CRL 75-36-700-3]